MEGAMAVRVTAAHTAEARAEAGREAGEGGVAAAAAAAAALAPGGFLGLPAPFSEEDEDDVHRCGRCQAEFTALEDFVQHKLQKVCQRAPQEALPTARATGALLAQEVVPAAAGPEEPITVAHIVVEAAALTADISHASDLVGGGHIKEVIVAAEAEPGDGEMAEAPGSPSRQGPGLSGEGEQAQVKLLVNEHGRYVCVLCHKTFKTGSILKAHMVTHSSRKDHECKLCGASFRTKGSLIRHHRRHTDERPYKCAKCGKSFRESGALTRHLKSLTPCTEKIRFSMSKDVVVGKEDAPAGSGTSTVGTVPSSSVTGEPMETSPVIHLVTDAKGTVIHEVHVQMQELPLGMKTLAPEVPRTPRSFPVPARVAVRTCYTKPCRTPALSLSVSPARRGPWSQPLLPHPVPRPWETVPQSCHCWRWNPWRHRWPVGPPLCPGPTRALSAVRPSRQWPPWRPTKGAMQGQGRSHACSAARPSPRPTCSRSIRRCTCTSAASAVETAGSSTRPSPTSAAIGASTLMSGPTRVPSVASATRPRMPSRCTSGHTWRRSRTCARFAAEASGRRAPWCGTCGTTRVRSPSSVTGAAAASRSTAHSTGTCAPKGAACWRWRSCWCPRRVLQQPPPYSPRTRTPCWWSSRPSWPTPRSTSSRWVRGRWGGVGLGAARLTSDPRPGHCG
ncbi:transcription factor E4F1 isoform X4 [Neomonachus schauinslandi]|uniref:Transcription factor E4F1 isoform X4 n=1 Tax=Neomonachus schauinslandi TaxID=29088 RepID=A0A8M1MG07_NEOSC|nr:transcription factor E4F1 isoform X4 [Neomonachus schauinslandi]